MSRARLYLDHAATSPLRPRAREAMESAWRWSYGNSASQHTEGREARLTLAQARAQVAALVGVAPEGVVFTSGATEATNLAVRGAAYARRSEHRSVVSTRLEHSATLKACEALANEGWGVSLLPSDRNGRVSASDLARVLEPGTAVVSVIAGHNELGTVQDLVALAEAAHAGGALFHLDAVQAVGYLDLSQVPWDLLSLSAHKLGGPQGIGALVMRGSPALRPVLVGGAQEGGLRPGTVPVALAAGFGAAAEEVRHHRGAEGARLAALRDRLGALLRERRPDLLPMGMWAHDASQALPHILALGIPGVKGDELVHALDELGVAGASSSACLSGTRSHVLEAVGLPEHIGVMRLSLGWDTTEREIDTAAKRIGKALEHLMSLAPFERRRGLIAQRAKEAGIVLTQAHWEATEAVFSYHHDEGILPGPRHLARALGAGVTLDQLFPRGIATIASWLGIPTPQGGCRPYAG